MTVVAWHDDMRTGIDSLDADHQRIIQLLNAITMFVERGEVKEAINEAVILSLLMDSHSGRELGELDRLNIENVEGIIEVQTRFRLQGQEISKRLVISPQDGAALAKELAVSFSNYLMTCGKMVRARLVERGL